MAPQSLNQGPSFLITSFITFLVCFSTYSPPSNHHHINLSTTRSSPFSLLLSIILSSALVPHQTTVAFCGFAQLPLHHLIGQIYYSINMTTTAVAPIHLLKVPSKQGTTTPEVQTFFEAFFEAPNSPCVCTKVVTWTDRQHKKNWTYFQWAQIHVTYSFTAD